VPAGSTTATYYVQALANSGTATYTASATGYAPGESTVELTPSGVVLSSDLNNPFVTIPTGVNQAPVRVNMAQLSPIDNKIEVLQSLRGGLNLNVTLSTGNTAIATITSPIAITGGAPTDSITRQVVRAGVGMTTLTATQPPGFVNSANVITDFKPMPTIQVNVN
jgi:hypothetical protein